KMSSMSPSAHMIDRMWPRFIVTGTSLCVSALMCVRNVPAHAAHDPVAQVADAAANRDHLSEQDWQVIAFKVYPHTEDDRGGLEDDDCGDGQFRTPKPLANTDEGDQHQPDCRQDEIQEGQVVAKRRQTDLGEDVAC